jgi:3-methylcrotonyl-CoA carboxylase beta subunit
MDALVADLEAKLANVRLGGGAKAAERFRGKGKKLPRERCVHLLRTLPFAPDVCVCCIFIHAHAD